MGYYYGVQYETVYLNSYNVVSIYCIWTLQIKISATEATWPSVALSSFPDAESGQLRSSGPTKTYGGVVMCLGILKMFV